MITCKRCHSEKVRIAHPRGFWETLQTILGIHPFRCRLCEHRFSASVWLVRKLPFAKCPRCLRTALTGWSRRHFKPSLQMEIQLALGAQKYRCEACRCNFVSFRPRKEIIVTTKSRWEHVERVEAQAEAQNATAESLLNLNDALLKEREATVEKTDRPVKSGQRTIDR